MRSCYLIAYLITAQVAYARCLHSFCQYQCMGTWLSFLIHAITILIIGLRDRTPDLQCTSEWSQPLPYNSAASPIGTYCPLLANSTSLTGLHKPREMHLRTIHLQPMLDDAGPHLAARIRMLMALIGFLQRSLFTKSGSRRHPLVEKTPSLTRIVGSFTRLYKGTLRHFLKTK